LEVELPCVPLCQDQPLIGELVTCLSARGYYLVSYRPFWNDPHTGFALQADGIFARRELVTEALTSLTLAPPRTGPAHATRMPRIVYFFRGGRADLLRRIDAGTAPREFLYGYDAFVEAGWDVSFVEPAPGDSRWLRPLLRPAEAVASALLGTNFTASNAAVHWRRVRTADVLLGTTDGNALPLLALKRIGVLRGKVMAITQGLHEKARTSGLRRRALAALLRQASQLVVLGVGDAEAVRDHFGPFGLPPVETAPFGIDEAFWTPAHVRRSDTILSVGSDHLRDFPTLLRAARDIPLRIVTRLELPPDLLTPWTTVNGDIDDLELRRLYRESRFVVGPTRNARRDSGHSVALQAMACGKAVILSDTPGLWDRERLRDGETCRLVPPENPEALRGVIRELWRDPAQAEGIGRRARRLVEEHWTSRHFGRHLVRLASSLV
jgi:glycosyltransferase involved in cell wall biosynthesis